MSIILKQVNEHLIKPIKIKVDPRPVKASDIYPELYGNIFMIAPTNTGKTTLIAYMLKKMVGKDTRVIVFSSTFYNDAIWGEIHKMLNKKGIEVEAYTSIKDQEGNHLRNIIDDLREKAMMRENEETDKKEQQTPEDIMNKLRQSMGVESYLNNEEPLKKKEKYVYPKIIIVFDDISEELRSPDLNVLLKQARHFNIRNIIASQYIKDLLPSSRSQIRGWILFANLSDQIIKDLHNSIGLRLPEDIFLQLYKHATIKTKKNPKPFFYFLPKLEEYRKGLTHRYIINESIYEPQLIIKNE